MYFNIYIASFLFTAIVYSIFSAFSKQPYINRPISELNKNERDVLYDRATTSTRFGIILFSFMECFMSLKILMMAGVLALIVSMISLVI